MCSHPIYTQIQYFLPLDHLSTKKKKKLKDGYGFFFFGQDNSSWVQKLLFPLLPDSVFPAGERKSSLQLKIVLKTWRSILDERRHVKMSYFMIIDRFINIILSWSQTKRDVLTGSGGGKEKVKLWERQERTEDVAASQGEMTPPVSRGILSLISCEHCVNVLAPLGRCALAIWCSKISFNL